MVVGEVCCCAKEAFTSHPISASCSAYTSNCRYSLNVVSDVPGGPSANLNVDFALLLAFRKKYRVRSFAIVIVTGLHKG